MNDQDLERQLEQLLSSARKEDLPVAQAIKLVDRVLETFRRIGLREQEETYTLRVLKSIGESYEALSCFGQAVSVYEEALEIARNSGERPVEGALLWNIGRVHRKRNRWETALTFLGDSEQIFQDLGDIAGVAGCQLSRALVDFEQGNYGPATEAFERALESGEQVDNARIVAAATMSLGNIASIRGDFDRAMVQYQNSLALYERIGRLGSVARIHHNLGVCLAAKRSWPEAIDAFERSLEVSEDRGDLRLAASTYVHKAAVYLELSDLTLAASYGSRALETFREIDFPLGVAEVYKVLGHLCVLKGDFTTAQSLLEASLELFESYRIPLGAAEAQRELGRLHVARGDVARGREQLDQAAQQFESLGAAHDRDITRQILEEL